ncbi:MAG: hypothetical protein J7K68_05175 [Candidatus Diapherotrites archaeon]|nr:hypothetical protein [Candidatus Diapherotrites archaeon]
MNAIKIGKWALLVGIGVLAVLSALDILGVYISGTMFLVFLLGLLVLFSGIILTVLGTLEKKNIIKKETKTLSIGISLFAGGIVAGILAMAFAVIDIQMISIVFVLLAIFGFYGGMVLMAVMALEEAFKEVGERKSPLRKKFSSLQTGQKVAVIGIAAVLFFAWAGLFIYELSIPSKRVITVYGEHPLTIMGQELNKVRMGGVASTSTAVVQFQEGVEYEADAIAEEVGMNGGMVVFCCDGADYGSDDSEAKCENYMFTDHDAFECDGETLTVNQNIAGRVRAYCPIGDGKCIIGFKVAR